MWVAEFVVGGEFVVSYARLAKSVSRSGISATWGTKSRADPSNVLGAFWGMQETAGAGAGAGVVGAKKPAELDC
jgi:hypothetical protein